MGLSRERIVGAAIELLDTDGERGLTFRALAARLKTGAGAIYWHVTNKDELLIAATEAILTGAARPRAGTPEDTLRAIALGVFDAVDEHPWVGTQLTRMQAQPALLRLSESIGRQVQLLGVPSAAGFDAATALLNYVLGVAGQNAALAGSIEPGTIRGEVLGTMAAEWEALDPEEFPYLRSVAPQLRDHDDRDQFLAGVDLVLAGMATLRGVPADPPRRARPDVPSGHGPSQ
ncbi:TetR/AcrR family transcriptional regulator [Symbioplanes lichenis]|uniref:TetR/AcrR family transcriptional regulator n=1 Tax=Symbioplanes lichenis TaxID=1629072 RepID=UPI00273A19C3|nr:TetR family transcriptional regulator [Actinoplanes lichenis]